MMDISVPEFDINYDYAIELLKSGEAKDKVKGLYTLSHVSSTRNHIHRNGEFTLECYARTG